MRETLKEVVKDGYVLRTELLTGIDAPGGEALEFTQAYTPAGNHIGNEQDAKELCVKHGIAQELRDIEDDACSIGWCEKDHKWYGWSHRAIYGFGIGSKIKKGDSGYSPKKGEWISETLDDAKQMACDFAESVR